jgi:hypothetical protein
MYHSLKHLPEVPVIGDEAGTGRDSSSRIMPASDVGCQAVRLHRSPRPRLVPMCGSHVPEYRLHDRP